MATFVRPNAERVELECVGGKMQPEKGRKPATFPVFWPARAVFPGVSADFGPLRPATCHSGGNHLVLLTMGELHCFPQETPSGRQPTGETSENLDRGQDVYSRGGIGSGKAS